MRAIVRDPPASPLAGLGRSLTHLTTAVNLGIVQAVMPVFILLIAFVRFRVQVTLLRVVGALAANMGVLLVASLGQWHCLVNTQFNVGDLLWLALFEWRAGDLLWPTDQRCRLIVAIGPLPSLFAQLL